MLDLFETAAPAAREKLYAFAGDVIRLVPKDYATLKNRFHAIPDFDAKLTVIDLYYACNPPNGGYFIPMTRWLEKDHVVALAAKKKAEYGTTWF